MLTIATVSTVIIITVVYPRLPSIKQILSYQPKLPLRIYSEDHVLLGIFGDEKRLFVPFKKIPKQLIDAIIAAEDARFYKYHYGFDIEGIIRAAMNDITAGSFEQGGSTITMQLARNMFLTSSKTLARKIKELLLAYKLDMSLSKNKILELYINQIYLGQHAYGFGAAAQKYFQKPLQKLSLGELAMLAGLPKAPSTYNPITDKDKALERQKYVLSKMLSLNLITVDEYRQAIEQPISVKQIEINDKSASSGYVAEMVRQILYKSLGDQIYQKGLNVYTTINSKMQQYAYQAVTTGLVQYSMKFKYNGSRQFVNLPPDGDNQLPIVLKDIFNKYKDFGILKTAVVLKVSPRYIRVVTRNKSVININTQHVKFNQQAFIVRGNIINIYYNNGWHLGQKPQAEGALLAMLPSTGAIKALVGGFNFNDNHFNHVTQAMRQPGSGFKPFIYSAALEKQINANTLINNNRVCYIDKSSKQWCPGDDISDRDFIGNVTVRTALAKSLNIATTKISYTITPKFIIDNLTKFGFQKSQFKNNLSIGLGTNEVSILQLARAYAVFANGGYLITPYIINYITDKNGKTIMRTQVPNTNEMQRTISARNAFLINSMLKDAVRYGTARRILWTIKHRHDIAGKTGTTNNALDAWFNGYTPNLVAISWVGFDHPTTLGFNAYGSSVALPIWIQFMSKIINFIPEIDYQIPEGLVVLKGAAWHDNDEYIYKENVNNDNHVIQAGKEEDDLNINKNITNNKSTSNILNSLINKIL